MLFKMSVKKVKFVLDLMFLLMGEDKIKIIILKILLKTILVKIMIIFLPPPSVMN